jgi:hypothetical protein
MSEAYTNRHELCTIQRGTAPADPRLDWIGAVSRERFRVQQPLPLTGATPEARPTSAGLP